MSDNLHYYLWDNLKELENTLKSAGCKQITSNKNGSYKPVNLGIRSYNSLCYGTLTGFNNDPKFNIRILLGTAKFRGGESLFIVIKKAELGNIPYNGYTTTDRYFTNNDYLIENVTVDTPIQTVRTEIINKINEIKKEINDYFIDYNNSIQRFLTNTNNRFNTVANRVKEGLIDYGCTDLKVEESGHKELTKENHRTAISFSFEVPQSELFMDLTLYMYLTDYDFDHNEGSIQGYINFPEIWIKDPNQITDIEQAKNKLERTDISTSIRRDGDIDKGVSEIIDRVRVLDTFAKKNIDLYNEMESGSLSVKSPDILKMSSILSRIPDLFVTALQKNNVSELDRGEKAYYNNFVKIKNEYERGNYDSLEELYDMFKFDYDEINRKIRNLQNKKGIRDQYNALFNIYSHLLEEPWQEIAKRFGNKSLWTLHN